MRIESYRNRIQKEYPDERPIAECRPCACIVKSLRGEERCSVSYSPSYWWGTREQCPQKDNVYAGG